MLMESMFNTELIQKKSLGLKSTFSGLTVSLRSGKFRPKSLSFILGLVGA
jgi:hypothetical protein